MKTIAPLLILLAFAQVSFGQLSGPLSGTLGPGVFHVVDTISVESGDSLTLLPGTTFAFDGPFPFRIYGCLLAEGTETDSIIFTTDTLANPDRWRGLRFSGAGSSASRLAYCLVEKGYAIGDWPDNYGGGVCCRDASPSFANCIFSGNSAYYGGGGVYFISSSPAFVHCSFTGNTGSLGGGILCRGSASFRDCEINGNSGGGVYCDITQAAFQNCVFWGNTGYAVYNWGASPTFTHCTLVGNGYEGYGGVYCFYSTPTFNSSIIAFSQGPGIFFHEDCAASQIRYCDIFGNSGGSFGYGPGGFSFGPPGIGMLDTINSNGDSCDTYHNIFLDPMFADTATGDYHLLAGSPCIDAGDPTLPFDPDTTIADIGAFYFDQLATEPPAILLPTTFALYPNWPNPFNSTTMIRYDVPQAGKVNLTIFNLLGQRVTTLFDGRQVAASHTVAWDAADLPSGVYLCRMQTQGFMQTRKMLLVK
jgi:hypothetical protein